MGTEEAPQLLLGGPSSPLGLPLKGAERFELTLVFDHPFDGGGTEAVNQLVLQVRDAHVEPEPLHLAPIEVGAEPSPLQAAAEIAFLPDVAESRQSDASPMRAEPVQKASDVGRASHGNDGNAFSLELPATTRSQGFERQLVTHPLDQDHPAKPLHPPECTGSASSPNGRPEWAE
jgi:hypothetical protein